MGPRFKFLLRHGNSLGAIVYVKETIYSIYIIEIICMWIYIWWFGCGLTSVYVNWCKYCTYMHTVFKNLRNQMKVQLAVLFFPVGICGDLLFLFLSRCEVKKTAFRELLFIPWGRNTQILELDLYCFVAEFIAEYLTNLLHNHLSKSNKLVLNSAKAIKLVFLSCNTGSGSVAILVYFTS